MNNTLFAPVIDLRLSDNVLHVTARASADFPVDCGEYSKAIRDMSGIDAGDKPQLKKRGNTLEVVAKIFSATAISKFATKVYRGLRLSIEPTGRVTEIAAWDTPHALSKSTYAVTLFKRELCDCKLCAKDNMNKDGATTYEGGAERHPQTGRYTAAKPEAVSAAEQQARDIYVAAMTRVLSDWDSSGPDTLDEVLRQAHATAAEAVRQAGFNVNDRITGGSNSDDSLAPQESQRDLDGSPERPAAKAVRAGSIRKGADMATQAPELFAALNASSRDAALLEQAQQTVKAARQSLERERLEKSVRDNSLLTDVLKSRIVHNDRQALPGSSSVLLKSNRERVTTLFRGNVLQQGDAISKSDGSAATGPDDTIAKSMTAVAAANERGAVPLYSLLNTDARGRPQVRAGFVFDIAGRAIADPIETLTKSLTKSSGTRRSGPGSSGLLTN